ncbi:MAG: MFS transporter, partial [Collinsella sp.]|nr:MFS transporter [Collinsella sp.]
VLLAAGITAFVYSAGEFSTNLIAGIVTLFAAVVLLGLFAARQLKLEHPVLNVRPMASVRFWPACLLVVVSMTTFSMSVLLPLYFEGAYGMTALVAGLLILPAIACNAVTSIVGGRVMDARGAWPLLPVGFALIAVGQTAISMTAASMNIGVVVALTVVVYAGVGLVLSPSQTAGLETLPAAEHPHGTALLNTWNMIAASFGPSLFIGLLSSSAATAGAAGVATDVAQAIGFATAVRVAAVIAVVGFVASLVYAHRESHMSH